MTGSETNTNVEFDGLDGQLPDFPGYLLRQAREEKGLSQQEAARELHLTSRVINGLENDDFSHVNSPIFARGYIRSYARHLGLDASALVAEYDAVYGSPDHGKKPMSTIRKVSEQARPGDAWVKLVSVVFLFALVGTSWWWWQSQRESADPIAVDEVTVQDSQGEDVLAILPEDENFDLQLGQVSNTDDSVGFTDETEQATLGVAEADTNADTDAETKAATTPTVAQPAADSEGTEVQPESTPAEPNTEDQASAPEVSNVIDLAPGQGLLLIEFIDDCWVEVQDGNGTMVLTDLKAKGQTIEMAVVAPAQILLGRASAAAKFEFAQRSIDIKPYTRKDIARVTLEL